MINQNTVKLHKERTMTTSVYGAEAMLKEKEKAEKIMKEAQRQRKRKAIAKEYPWIGVVIGVIPEEELTR